VFADYLAVGGHEFAGSVRQRLTSLRQICIEELLVVASRNEADLLRIRLGGEREPVMPRQIANLGLGHFSEWKQSAAELLLGQAEQEIGLVLGGISRTLE